MHPIPLLTRCLRQPLSVLWLVLATSGGGLAVAQVQVPSVNLMPGAAAMGWTSQTAAPGATGIAAPGLQMPGASALPMLPQRPDLGAADAGRAPLSALRPPSPQAPSQFQRFVQESTGKLLPVFGANLFDNPLAYAADSTVAAPGEYVLGPGDEVRVTIAGPLDYAGSQTVDRNGQISLPKVGTLNLVGVQVKDLEATVRKQVATVFTNVTVNASLGKLRGVTVYVVGQARQPGTYNLTSLSTLVNAVFASGGPAASGSMRQITLKRAGKTVATLDLYDFIAKGDKGRDALLQPGDVITIPPAGPRVALTGATDLSAIYELQGSTTVQDLLTLAGGVPALASQQKALIERIDPQQANALRRVQHLVLNAQGLSQLLRDGDVITLLPISPAFGNAVTLQGAVAQPLRHAWYAGMRVADLIPEREALISPDFYKRRNQLVQNRIATLRAQGFTTEQIQALQRAEQLPEDVALSTELIARTPQPPSPGPDGKVQYPPVPVSDQDIHTVRERLREFRNPVDRVRGFTDQINWEYAVIQRLNKAELKTELIPFNLAKAIIDKDPAHNLVLQPDDVVTIMNSADLRLPVAKQTRLVRIEGEVASPGVYQAQPGETIGQLIARAGGLTPQAYLYGIEFTRESVRKQQQQNLDQLVRRLEAQLQSASATLAANLTGERALQSQALQQQQQQQMQSQINRLKSLRSKGRVALELDAEVKKADALPALPLEDGDAILVPSQPAFVAVAGSVNNENVIIYKPGRTVGDVLKAASLTEDAQPSEAFVLRADGSVLSRRSTTGIFSSFESTRVMPGDTLVVPPKVDRESNYNFLVRALRDWTQIFSNLGIGAAAIRTLRN